MVKFVGWIVDKRAGSGDDNILRFCARLIHDDLVESGHKKLHNPTLIDLDFIRG
jgi:hypothetical protein